MNSLSGNSGLESKNLLQRGNTLLVTFPVSSGSGNLSFVTKFSPEITINGAAVFQVMVITFHVRNTYNNLIFIRFLKASNEDDLAYMIKVSSNELQMTNKTFRSDDGTWHLINENKKQQYILDINVVMESIQCSTFATLYDDTDLTDFELRGDDGSVPIHRAVLAASSPVLKRMLSGSWRETAEGHVNVPGTSKKTLQHLKDYMYLHTLPDTGLEQILQLASYYMMPGLEQMCVDRLVSGLVAENACDIMRFAAKHGLTKLLLAVLDSVQSGAIRVNEIREHYLRTKVT